MSYAGIEKRYGAGMIDLFLIWSIGFALVFALKPVFIGSGIADRGTILMMGGTIRILQILFGWMYFAILESSPLQGTFGKMIFSIKVTDLEGQRIDFNRATVRYFGKFVSTIILMIGFIMIAFTSKRQGLHDKIADCLVLNK